MGCRSVVYRKRFFSHEVFDYDANHEFQTHCRRVDDVWFSGHLEHRRVRRFMIAGELLGKGVSYDPPRTQLDRRVALSGNWSRRAIDNLRCAWALRRTYGVWAGPAVSVDSKRAMAPAAATAPARSSAAHINHNHTGTTVSSSLPVGHARHDRGP
eukprot:1943797-Prymnesium_polylepis.1